MRFLFLLSYLLMLPLVWQDAIAGANEAKVAYKNGDYPTAMVEFLKLSEQGDIASSFILGIMYQDGQGVEKSLPDAMKFYRVAAEGGFKEAQYTLAMFSEESEDYKNASLWYNKAAEQGHIEAQLRLARLYEKGVGLPLDLRESAKWYRQAAEQGSIVGQLQIGHMYEKGRGVPQNYKEAFKWYSLAAKQNSNIKETMVGASLGKTMIGAFYEEGTGVAKNYTEAAKWYRMAGEQGESAAQYGLGKLYLKGWGVKRDLVIAYMLLSLSAANGCDDAIELRADTLQKLTSKQLEEGQNLASDWRPGAAIPKKSISG